MILVDTSIWIEHLRRSNDDLFDLLERGQVLGHPFVVGEIALGGVKPQTLVWLRHLPVARIASDIEVLDLIQRHRLAGRGVGYVDAHLVASCLLTPGARLWTLDKSLHATATDLGLIHQI